MATVYVVTQGSYSDYHIKAIFSTEEAAKTYASQHPGLGGDLPEVEEWELDKWVGSSKVPTWTARISISDGTLEVHKDENLYLVPQGVVCPFRYYRKNPERVTVGSTVSAKHAEKLAVEARQECLRRGSVSNIDERD